MELQKLRDDRAALLEALEETLDGLAYRLADSARSPVVQRARAAIAKARGGK